MENIKDIIKQTFIGLKNKKQIATPENYFREFKDLVEENELHVEEVDLFDSLLGDLTSSEKRTRVDSFSQMAKILSKRSKKEDLTRLAEALDDILVPSVNYKIKDEVEDFILEISQHPEKLLERDSIQKIKVLSQHRVEADREILIKKTNDIIKLSSLMSKYFDRSLLESSSSSSEINKIREELTSLNISEASQRELGSLQTKLVDTIYNIENSMEQSRQELDANKIKFNQLHKTIEALQYELNEAKKEKSIDFLTNILNRRAFEEEVEKIEKKHKIFGTDYAIVFYDIDHFKAINDTYGHSCGDAVLRTFGGILKKLTRREDIIARYGGEEFIALINYETENELTRYIKRVKSIIEKSDFNYKGNKIEVKISAGISFRAKYDSYSDAKKEADELLYKAKNNGRDKVYIDNGIEI